MSSKFLPYIVTQGNVTEIIDRNGNKTRLAYQNVGQANVITDSLDRPILIDYNSTDTQCANRVTNQEHCERITFWRTKAGGGAEERYIYVIWADATKALKTGFSASTQLFPLGGGTDQIGSKPVLVILPNGTTYKLSYNPFGDVARIELPTGAAVEYDHDAGLANAGSAGVSSSGQVLDLADSSDHDWALGGVMPPAFAPFIYRRLMQKRNYATATSTQVDSTISYSRPESATPTKTDPNGKVWSVNLSNLGYVDTTVSAIGLTSSVERHSFYGAPAQFLLDQSQGFNLSAPNLTEGKEHTTQTGPNSSTFLSTVQRVFGGVQAQEATWAYTSATGSYQTVGGVTTDLQLCQELDTNELKQTSGKLYFYVTAVQNRQKSSDPRCKRGFYVPETGILKSRSAASS